MKYRDTSTTIMVFIAFLLSFIVLWNVSDLVTKIENQEQGLDTYNNVKNVNIMLDKTSELIENGNEEEAKKYTQNTFEDIFNHVFELSECNISVTSMYFTIKHKEANVNAEIIFKENEDLPYIIEKQYDKNGQVIIGESLKKYIHNNDANITLSNELYLVNGILKNYGMSRQDERVIILFDRLSKEQKNEFIRQIAEEYSKYNDSTGLTLRVGSNNLNSTEKTFNLLSDYLDDLDDVEYEIVPTRKQPGEQNYWYQLYHSIFGSISVLFAVINGIVVSDLWYQRRRREFLIRRIFGYSGIRIWFLIWKEMGKIAITSLACSILLWILYCFVKDNTIVWNLIGMQCLVMAFGTMLVIFITTIIPYVKTMTIEPAKGLCGYREK